jgi:hypothetical protein
MSYYLPLNSAAVSQPANLFTVQFPQGIILPKDTPYEVGLHEIDIWYSVSNVNATNNTQAFAFTAPTGSYTGATGANLPQGIYQATDIGAAIGVILAAAGASPTGITIANVVPQATTSITVATGYSLDLTKSNLNQLLGFNQGVYSYTGSGPTYTYVGQNQANISLGINGFSVQCSLVDASYSFFNGTTSNVLFSSAWQTFPASQQVSIPPKPIYLPVPKSNYFDSITITITDQTGKALNFNNGVGNQNNPVNIVLSIRPQKQGFMGKLTTAITERGRQTGVAMPSPFGR